VSGPFTVESLSPRVLVSGPEDAEAAQEAPSVDAGAFVTGILDNLRRAGVQNTKRAERLEFTRLDPYPGVFVQGVGEYTEAGDAWATINSTVSRPVPRPSTGKLAIEVINHCGDEALKVVGAAERATTGAS
jgi:adenine-specific DNA-methyltransferase